MIPFSTSINPKFKNNIVSYNGLLSISVILFFAGAYFLFTFINTYANNPEYMDIKKGWDNNSDDVTKLERTQWRGTLISTVLMISAAVQAILKSTFNANSTNLLTFMVLYLLLLWDF